MRNNMDKRSFLAAWEQVRRGFRYHQTESGVGSYTLPGLAALSCVRHGFSARTGGVSTGRMASLNLSFSREGYEPREVTMQNYRIFCAAEGIPEESMVMDTYEHGTTVFCVDRNDCKKGWTEPSLPPCDGLVSNDPAVTLVTGHADCMAFYLVDPNRRAIGLAHAGWRGALGRIGSELVASMRQNFGTDPKDLFAGVGPSICPEHFEVDESLGQTFLDAFPYTDCLRPGKPGKAYVDLWQVAAGQFLEAGVLPERIEIAGVCTFEDDRLYSYRREHVTGGMAAYLRLV